jgi:hypothetical protein
LNVLFSIRTLSFIRPSFLARQKDDDTSEDPSPDIKSNGSQPSSQSKDLRELPHHAPVLCRSPELLKGREALARVINHANIPTK